jgi:riboflavin kinase/FMN adenylyltransferase
MSMMTVRSWEEFIGSRKDERTPVGMSIGVFDGVHKGHLALVTRILDNAAAAPWIVTFRSNPSRSLHPESYPGDLMSLGHKLEKLETLGIATTIIIDFSQDFSKLRGADFLSLIRRHCALSYIAVGEDFHCGRDMDTNAGTAKELLKREGVHVEIVPPVFEDGERISSTRIRNFVMNGDLGSAEKMLGHRYKLDLSSGIPEGAGLKKTLKKAGLFQVAPEKGKYAVIFENAAGIPKEGSVDIDENTISWHYNGKVEAITFV